MRPRRPLLRYHGGKYRIATRIMPFFPAHRIYVEPYGGGGGVLLKKPRSFAEVYNDLDRDVVNVFKVMRDPEGSTELRRQIELTPWSREEFFKSYEPCEEPIERARRTIVRGFMGFGTTSRRAHRTGFRARAYRQNQTGAMDWTNWPDEIPIFVERLRGVTIECRDALDVIGHQDTVDTLFYCDPPYVLGTRTSSKFHGMSGAYAHDMTDDDHGALAAVLHQVKGMVVLSGYACDLYDRDLYADWERHELRTVADGGRPRTEILWLNPAASFRRQARRRVAADCVPAQATSRGSATNSPSVPQTIAAHKPAQCAEQNPKD